MIPLYIIAGKITLTDNFLKKKDLLLSSVSAHGCYIKTANVIATSCLCRVFCVAYLKVIFIVNI